MWCGYETGEVSQKKENWNLEAFVYREQYGCNECSSLFFERIHFANFLPAIAISTCCPLSFAGNTSHYTSQLEEALLKRKVYFAVDRESRTNELFRILGLEPRVGVLIELSVRVSARNSLGGNELDGR